MFLKDLSIGLLAFRKPTPKSFQGVAIMIKGQNNHVNSLGFCLKAALLACDESDL